MSDTGPVDNELEASVREDGTKGTKNAEHEEHEEERRTR